MSTTTTTAATSNDIQPQAWVACLHCYNNGRLLGDWFTLDELEEINIREVHRANPKMLTTHCEEYTPFDVEFLPRTFSINDFQTWLDAWRIIGDTSWPAFLEFVDWYGFPDPAEFEDTYLGNWNSWEEYVEENLLDEVWSEVPEHLHAYIDIKRYARDSAHDYHITDDNNNGVYVFYSV